MDLPDGGSATAIVLHDSDTKFHGTVSGILKSEGLPPKKLIPVSPNPNAYVERFISDDPAGVSRPFCRGGRVAPELHRAGVFAVLSLGAPTPGTGSVPPVIPLTPADSQADRRLPRAARRAAEALRPPGGVKPWDSDS